MSKILKTKKLSDISIITPDLSPIKNEVFKSLFEIDIEKEEKLESSKEKIKEEIFQKGYKEGFEKGYAEGQKKGYKDGFKTGKKNAEKKYKELEINLKKDFQEKIQFIERFLKKLENEAQNLIINMDKEILNLALEIANKLVLKEIEIDPEIPIRIIKEALNYIAEGTELNIKVNPEEYKFLKENLSKYIAPSQKIKLIPDESISKGGIFIETSLGVIDATFEKRWKKLLETLVKNED
ncbi:MAG: Flagellar biosynthesis/type III secretory pathway protein FliH [Thermodesulfobacterium sp.]|uniref:Flagellar assembly protein FliH n=1 Tax=Candidatus Thermodesulfobacterium syntrophicum TaxID=3060442 RepID=A0AAE3P643_9BACT|nr:Flagellar biosynthesis/type III secretory pathway protein FliH [Candidatus Thermodesulfobacterium syntrophicum]